MMAPQREDADVPKLLASMDWEDKIGQMAQIDINILLNEEKTALQQDLLDRYIGELGIGSVLNNVAGVDGGYWNISHFRRAAIQIQRTAERYGRPPVIWGLDSVHGANYLWGTITTPQPINLAASFNSTLSRLAGEWASRDTRAAGITWIFGPLLGLAWEPSWPRVYETFGEDPVLVGTMAGEMVAGIQAADDGAIPSRAAACGKHWVGYSLPRDGHDRAPSWIPTRHLYQYFLLPWKRVVNRVETVMESYTEVDGVPNVANRQTLTRMLRQELNFDGVLVTDYHEIFNLHEWHRTAGSPSDALRQSLEEGSVDVSMIAMEPDEYLEAAGGLDASRLAARVTESARRMLELKSRLGMFRESLGTEDAGDGGAPPGADLRAALEMTHQVIALTENRDGALPLDPASGLKVLVTGPTSASLSFQTGGWTGQWQGVDSGKEGEWFTYGSTVRDALRREENWDVSHECGVDILGRDCEVDSGLEGRSQREQHAGIVDKIEGWVGWSPGSVERAAHSAKGKDVVVVCIGEENYAEKPGDIRSLELPAGQYGLVATVREAAPDAKIILVYFGGRPRLLSSVVDIVDAVFVGFLPGPYAGTALADLLTGRSNPSARLPITYPKYQDGGGIPYLHSVSDMCTKDTGGVFPHWDTVPCEVQWPFGHGLSYTQFEYENVLVSDTRLNYNYQAGEEPFLTVLVTVTNTGSLAGAEAIMFFTFDSFRSTTPEYKRLRGFEKVWLEPSASTEVRLTIPLDDFRFIGPHDDTHYILENGLTFQVGVGAHVDCRTPNDDTAPLCSQPVTISTGDGYCGACESACNVWKSSGCSDRFRATNGDCWEMCTSIQQDLQGDLQLNNDGWGWNYVKCIESIVSEKTFTRESDCWKLTSFCRDVFSTPGMDEFGHGPSPKLASRGLGAMALVVLLAGILSSGLVACVWRGGLKKREEDFGDIQFASVRSQDIVL